MDKSNKCKVSSAANEDGSKNALGHVNSCFGKKNQTCEPKLQNGSHYQLVNDRPKIIDLIPGNDIYAMFPLN